MPWTCKRCGSSVGDDAPECGSCDEAKSAWTVVFDRTRTLVIGGQRRFTLQRGNAHTSAPAGDPAAQQVSLSPAEAITVLGADELQRLADAGQAPATAYVLFVCLHPQGSQALDVGVEVLYDGLPSEEHTVAAEFDPDGEVAYARLVFADAPPEGVAFDGLTLIDVHEPEAPEGVAPSVEFAALGRPPEELPTTRRKLRAFTFSV